MSFECRWVGGAQDNCVQVANAGDAESTALGFLFGDGTTTQVDQKLFSGLKIRNQMAAVRLGGQHCKPFSPVRVYSIFGSW